MPPEHAIKFRCDRCGQLLGVSPSRAGRPVKCPKCGAGLLVPSPDDPADPSVSTALGTSTEDSASPPSSGFFDAVDLDQDDLRTLFPVDSREDRSDREPFPFASEPDSDDEPEADEPDSVRVSNPQRPSDRPGHVPIIDEVGGSGSDSISALFDERAAHEGQSTDGDSRGSASPRPRGARDVLVPRMALLAWSLFVLIALFLAFLAGLLVGHFVWKG